MESPATPCARLSKEATTALKTWFNAHRQFPYLSEAEKVELQAGTGLTSTQVSNWFTNARRRNKARRASAPIPTTPRKWIDLQSEKLSNGGEDSGLADLPFLGTCTSQRSSSVQSGLMPAEYGSPMCSNSEHNLSGLVDSLNRRRRRKRRHTGPHLEISASHRKYQCTFCPDRFRTKWDWTRHESAQHISFERWVCAPFGPRQTVGGSVHCVFCNSQDPSDAHLESHRYSDCVAMSVACRFYGEVIPGYELSERIASYVHLFNLYWYVR